MMKKLLLKGFEVELFTGSSSGEHVGVASLAADDLQGFVKEPDQRNLEFVTSPEKKYSNLRFALLEPRRNLRNWLAMKKLTILPGSTLSLGCSKNFERSDIKNEYHELIEKNYGTDVVTTSVHINFGIENLSNLFSALRLVKCESALFLALSASSPFLDGKPTGVHSQRWIQFPRTPKEVPIFKDHSHYVKWVEEKLAEGVMWNERHFWTSVRPNGPHRPYELNRLEVRVCDLITDCDLLLAVTALLELRIISLINNPKQLDPLQASKLTLNDLAILSDLNDIEAAKASVNSTLSHWVDGSVISCKEWIYQILESVEPLAKEMGLKEILEPINDVLLNGNQSIKWLRGYAEGRTIQSLLEESVNFMEQEEILSSSNSYI